MKRFDHQKFQKLITDLETHWQEVTDKQLNDHAQSYKQRKLSKVIELKQTVYDDRILHKIRTQIKRTGDILNLMNKTKLTEEIKLTRKNIKVLDKSIGKWHDIKILIDSLKSYILLNENRNVRSYLNRVISQYERKNEISRKSIEKFLSENFTVKS